MEPYIRMNTEFRKQAKSDFNYPKERTLYEATNKKVLGKMKDECGGEPIEEVVARRAKMYSIKKAESNIKKTKGVKKKM